MIHINDFYHKSIAWVILRTVNWFCRTFNVSDENFGKLSRTCMQTNSKIRKSEFSAWSQTSIPMNGINTSWNLYGYSSFFRGIEKQNRDIIEANSFIIRSRSFEWWQIRRSCRFVCNVISLLLPTEMSYYILSSWLVRWGYQLLWNVVATKDQDKTRTLYLVLQKQKFDQI